ncbi:sensor histidine kinase [Corynebacterium liangguodongii]|uniref:histidine kinase n=1 Tax=Corynebacterium liangguodongii TaxID=2079535 RepID=A0A2S0WDY7_9CORY|nr:histidine kinase [Corynebacterium liangguodongii]AWB83944.1 sensor histidine kinase [Corynebacterium liangguodongii]PWB99083.1 sensor histidine kinase [Corynebacterium liangguodongii]
MAHTLPGPLSYPRRIGFNWIVAAVGILAIALSAVVSQTTIPQLALNVTAVAIVALAQRRPIAMGIAMVVLFTFMSAFAEFRNPVIVLSAPFLATFMALGGRSRFALAVEIYLCFITVTSPFTNQWIPYDWNGTVIYSVMLAAGLWAGIYFRSQRNQHAEYQRRLREDMETRKETLTRALHDSVATTLTSVVMRAETLALTSSGEPKTQETAEFIADEARQAMQEVRLLLELVRDDGLLTETSVSRSVSDQISVTARLLRSHGFDVRGDESSACVGKRFPPGFEKAFAELATNAIKYAVRGSIITLCVGCSDESLRFRMTNEIEPRPTARHMTSGIGLTETKRLVVRHRGEFWAGKRDGQWVVEFEIPSPAEETTPKRVET